MPRTRKISTRHILQEAQQTGPQRVLVQGKIIEADSPAVPINRAANTLLEQDGQPPAPRDASINLAAFNVLFSLGVTLAKEKKSYSLLDDQTNTEVVENIAIFDPIYATLTNTPTEAKDKFSNNKDPFYELDDALPQDEKRRRDKIIEDKLTPRVERITNEIIKLNLDDPKTPTLKQFKNNRDYSIELEQKKKKLLEKRKEENIK